MSDEVKFLPYEVAEKIVGAVNEEEHIHEMNRRILTVYDKQGRELCWYDAEEILEEIGMPGASSDEAKKKAVEHIMHHIPQWAAKTE